MTTSIIIQSIILGTLAITLIAVCGYAYYDMLTTTEHDFEIDSNGTSI